MQYRAKPFVVSAFKVGCEPEPSWFPSDLAIEVYFLTHPKRLSHLLVRTRQGQVSAFYGEWIINFNDEIFVLSDKGFRKSFRKVDGAYLQGFGHPCKDTCSGYTQGMEAGFDLANNGEKPKGDKKKKKKRNQNDSVHSESESSKDKGCTEGQKICHQSDQQGCTKSCE